MAAIIDIEVLVVHQTDRAILIKEDEDAKQIWLPLSLIEVDPNTVNGVTTISLPDWLAEREGLI